MLRALLAAALVAVSLAGCTADPDPVTPPLEDVVPGLAGPLYKGTGHLFAGAPLYRDPQNTPHPAFNFPTLAHPATGAGVPDLWKPIEPAALPEHVAGLEHVAQAGRVASGAGIAIFGGIVLVPGYGQPTAVVDISDPAAPQVLSTFKPQEGLSSHRGAAFVAYPDGRLSAVISTGSGIDHWDLTDPAAPKPLPPLLEDADGQQVRSHKVGVIPGTPIVVNARSGGGAPSDPETSPGKSEMWDLSDPAKPVALPAFRNGYACHHVYFWNDLEEGKFRGTCAGIQYTQIWDTTDPYNPSVIVSVPFGTGGTAAGDTRSAQFPLSISHYAGLSLDGKVLLMGDESGGGGLPPGCTVRADTPLGGISPPIGAVWFYDVSDERNPRLLSWISASQLEKMGLADDPQGLGPRSCTAHHGRLVPVEGRDVLAMSFYASGVVVIDFTSVRGEGNNFPTVVAQWADHSDTWETWYYQGYLFTGDLARGMDVLRLV